MQKPGEYNSRRSSIADRMVATSGRSTGFDYLRIILALGVIVWHSFSLSYGAPYDAIAAATPMGPFIDAIVPMFFALSGFLVAGSLERNSSLVVFVGLRIIRILPALAVEVVLSALILGPLLTAATLGAYFTDVRFYAYFLNIVGDIHYVLPRLFQSNPLPNFVNGQLWTVPWEMRCYIVLTGAAIFGFVSRRKLFLAATLLSCAGLLILFFWSGASFRGTPLLIGFLAGVAIYRFKDVVPWDARLAVFCGLAMYGLHWIPSGNCIFGLPAAYLTVYLGLVNPRKIVLLRGADYSYGLYLYGFAIQQAVAQIFPWSHEWYLNLALTIPIAALFAAMSWTFVEKPAVRLKNYLPRINNWLALSGRPRLSQPQAPS
jgi:peptidoglycan/LPS O-acetylase OafA/YrhL